MARLIGRSDEAVLRILMAAGGEAPMGDIFEALAALGKRTTFGALYTTLSRMRGKKLITRQISGPRPIPGGRSRYFYKITNAGRAAIIEVERAAAAFEVPFTLRPVIAR